MVRLVQLTFWFGLVWFGSRSNELDQFWSAKFIEDMDSAITALERKAALKEIDQVSFVLDVRFEEHASRH